LPHKGGNTHSVDVARLFGSTGVWLPAHRDKEPFLRDGFVSGAHRERANMARLTVVTGILLALAGCDSGGGERQQSTNGTTKINVSNPFHEKMQGLTPLNRALALKRAIQDSGQRCTRMLGSAYVGQYERMHVWTGRCQQPDRDFAVFIAANGEVQVRDCVDVASLGLPACKEPEPLPKT
jgi:hypothetical protein